MVDSKLICKARRSAQKAKIRTPCVSCIAYNHRCSDTRPCKRCLKANRSCVDGSNLETKYQSGPSNGFRTATENRPELRSAVIIERECPMRPAARPGFEWAYSETRKFMGVGYRVEFIERFFTSLSTSDIHELNREMANAAASCIIPGSQITTGIQTIITDQEADCKENTATDAIFCASLDFSSGHRTIHSNENNAALFGMRCEEFLAKASYCDIPFPLCEVDALILLLYLAVYKLRGREPTVMYLRMYTGATRTGSLIRQQLSTVTDEQHRPKEVRRFLIACSLVPCAAGSSFEGCSGTPRACALSPSSLPLFRPAYTAVPHRPPSGRPRTPLGLPILPSHLRTLSSSLTVSLPLLSALARLSAPFHLSPI